MDDRRITQKAVDDLIRLFARRDDSNPRDRFLPPPERAGDLRLRDSRAGADMAQEPLRLVGRAVERQARAAALELFDRGENLGFAFRTETLDGADQPFFAGGL